MPVIVDEVVISVQVSNSSSGGSAVTPAPLDERQAMVAECVERVLDILRQKVER